MNPQTLAGSIATLPLVDAHAAFGILANAYVRRIRGLVKRVAKSVDPDDVAQDVLIRLWEALRQGAYDASQDFERWLWQITRRAAISAYRHIRATARISGSAEPIEAAERNADASQDVETRDLREVVADRLDARERSVFALLCSATSIADVCRLTGLSQPTIWRAQQRINDVCRAVCAA